MSTVRDSYDIMERAKYESKDNQPLLSRSAEDAELQAERLLRNFYFMCVCFSANHGCVVACIAYASSELGDLLGGYGTGSLYICYALTAFFLSKPVITMTGPKIGLILGVGGYCIYILGFLLAILLNGKIRWPVFIFAACVGGMAGGLLWTAQGRYFSKNAALYSEVSEIPLQMVNSKFAGIFAASYLGLECITKLLATVVFIANESSAPSIIFTIYTCIAFAASFGMTRIQDLNEHGSWNFDTEVVIVNVVATGSLLFSDVRLALMIPFQVAFGLASSFVPFYVFGTVIDDSDELGGTYIGVLGSVVVLTGAVTAIPAAWAAEKYGKQAVMTIGGLGLVCAGLVFLFLDNDQIGTWAVIIPYLIIYGIGRGTWENTNKAVIADFFASNPSTNTAAFAGISFTSGLAGAVGYFMFPNISRDAIAVIVTGFGGFAIICYFFAHRANLNHINSRDI